MYELILTVMVKFAGPVAELDGGRQVSMVTQRYEVAVQGFASKEECLTYDGYDQLSSSLAASFGAATQVVPESTPRCWKQPAATH